MTLYRYSGPPSGVTLSDGTEVLFVAGRDYELPAGNRYVQSLVAQRFLAELPAPTPPARKTKTTSKE